VLAGRLIVVAQVEVESESQNLYIIFQLQALKPGTFNTGSQPVQLGFQALSTRVSSSFNLRRLTSELEMPNTSSHVQLKELMVPFLLMLQMPTPSQHGRC
jgi:hypothetical protein